MKTFLLLASALGVAWAGVGTLSPQEEAEALQMFQKLCSGSSGGYGGGGYSGGSDGAQNIGGVLVYCKRATENRQEVLNHNVNVQDNTRQPAQVVFVQPPPVRYTHRVLVQGSGAQGQQTKVYVLPQQATHELSANYQGSQPTPQKPTVYFLKGDGPSSGGYGPPQAPPSSSYGTPQAPPSSNYGPPQAPPSSNYGAPQAPPSSSYGAPNRG